jgi:hypothetical protein
MAYCVGKRLFGVRELTTCGRLAWSARFDTIHQHLHQPALATASIQCHSPRQCHQLTARHFLVCTVLVPNHVRADG